MSEHRQCQPRGPRTPWFSALGHGSWMARKALSAFRGCTGSHPPRPILLTAFSLVCWKQRALGSVTCLQGASVPHPILHPQRCPGGKVPLHRKLKELALAQASKAHLCHPREKCSASPQLTLISSTRAF